MATRGWEFAYMLDGSNATPLIRDLPMDGTGAYKVGDLVLLNSDGQCAAVASAVTEVTGVVQEARSSGTDGDNLKVAIITRNQVWRCSGDATSAATAIVGYVKTMDMVDENTVDADNIDHGAFCVLDASQTDDAGNVLFYGVFLDTTFGNT